MVIALRLPLLSLVSVNLADDRTVALTMFSASICGVVLNRKFVCSQRASASSCTALLDSFELLAQLRENGLVTINALETRYNSKMKKPVKTIYLANFRKVL